MPPGPAARPAFSTKRAQGKPLFGQIQSRALCAGQLQAGERQLEKQRKMQSQSREETRGHQIPLPGHADLPRGLQAPTFQVPSPTMGILALVYSSTYLAMASPGRCTAKLGPQTQQQRRQATPPPKPARFMSAGHAPGGARLESGQILQRWRRRNARGAPYFLLCAEKAGGSSRDARRALLRPYAGRKPPAFNQVLQGSEFANRISPPRFLY